MIAHCSYSFRRWLLFTILFLLPLLVMAQPAGKGAHISDKELSEYYGFDLDKDWKYSYADDLAMATPRYDDSKWELVSSDLLPGDKDEWTYENFNGIAWLRKELIIDSSLLQKPLVLSMSHYGASEVFIDCMKVVAYGKIGDKENTVYENIRDKPYIFTFTTTGSHLLAVRYANFNARSNEQWYRAEQPGFTSRIGMANIVINRDARNDVNITLLLMLLFGIFAALTIAHVFLFLYQPGIRSNLYFTILCFSLALLSLLVWISLFAKDPMWELSLHYSIPVCISGFYYAMSGFVNNLFAAKKMRFKVISWMCLLAIPVFLLQYGIGLMFYVALLVTIMLEAIILISKAMYRKVHGARIIGVGMLLFTVFVFTTTVYLSLFWNISFDGSAGAVAFVLIAGLAILSLPVSMSLYLAWSFAAVNKDLKANLVQVQELSAKTIEQELEKIRLVETQKDQLEIEVAARTAQVVQQKEEIQQQNADLKHEKQKSDKLLLNILPAEVAEELKERGHSDARSFNNVTVLFTDFVDFTKAGERMSPQELVDELHVCFKTFDEIISRHKIEKIKTIGDAYLAVGGLPAADDAHALNAVLAALEIRTFMKQRRAQLGTRTFDIRIGIHSGSVVAGIVGIKKFAYDIWGDTVNTAARMEQSSEPGKINISESTFTLVKDHVHCQYRGRIDAKNKGELNMYFVEA